MSNERRKKAAARLEALGIQSVSQDMSAIPVRCPFDRETCDPDVTPTRIDLPALTYRCNSCGRAGELEELLSELEASSLAVQDADFDEQEPQSTEIAIPLASGVINAELVDQDSPLELARSHIIKQSIPRELSASPPRRAESWIITLLAVVFLIAGLAAAGLSGFANYRAFSESVADPLQSSVWGWTGVIASIISFGGFTFFYWHTANKRMKEGLRALVFAAAGVVTSVIGTQMYIANNSANASNLMQQATSNRTVIETQIADWRTQLDGIPADTGSVEGLESYIKEVERVGRSHQKPYRDAQNELGLAKRRDVLLAKIEAANADLLGVGETGLSVTADRRPSLPSWFFAIMLEIFSSQGTSIALVALLIVYGRRRSA